MKKIKLFALLGLAALACACQPKNEDPVKPEVSFSLSDKNIVLSGLEGESIVTVNNSAKTVGIFVEYVDKENIKALEVDFTGLEEGVEVNYTKVFNYSTGAQTVTFVKDGTEFPYSFAVTVGAAQPKFTSLTVGGVDAMGGVVKLSGSADLASLVVEFEVSPADAKVFVGDRELASGDKVDFSDKLNGVELAVRAGEAVSVHVVKVETTGISSVKRVWGEYVKPFSEGVKSDWFGSMVTGEANVIRTVAMSDEYVFLSKDKDGINPKGGVYAVSIKDPESVRLLSQEGIPDGTRFFGISTLGNAPIAASFTMGQGVILRIYRWLGETSAPELVLEYMTTENMRLGDKLVAEGTWQDGKIWLHDATSGTKELCFTVKDDKVIATPTIIDLDTKVGNYGCFYPYKDGQYVWAGAGVGATLFNVSGTSGEKVYEFPTSIVSAPTLGPRFFTFNEENYMAYCILKNSYQDGQFRITALERDTLEESIENATHTYQYWLGDPNATEDGVYVKNANASGDCAMRVIDGKTYFAAYVCGTGLSLFEIE